MKKRIENYLPEAIKLIKEVKIADNNNKVDNRFSGYFSAFGAAIVLSGMKPALAFYANSNKIDDRTKILHAVYKLVVPEGEQKDWKPKELLLYYTENENNKMLKHKILDATVALKLAVRTYNLEKK